MSPAPVRLLIHGASGRMGQGLLRLAQADPRFRVVAAVSGEGTSPISPSAVRWFSASAMSAAPPFDVAIDFSLPAALAGIVDLCAERGSPLVCGTTGLDAGQMARLEALAASVPVLWASNFSLGVTVMEELVRRASAALNGWQVKIVETHHVHKKDAPSGTALSLARAVASAGHPVSEVESIRAGEVVGDHRLIFEGAGESLELLHRALDRDIFALGALEACRLLRPKSPATYQLAQLIFDRS